MKFIKIIFFGLLALMLIASCGIFIFFQTFDPSQYTSQIDQKASRAIGRPVTIGNVGLGLSLRGITLDAGPMMIADNAGFTTEPFIKVDRVRISPDLISLLFRREIHINSILLQSPQIHFIRNREGNFNAAAASLAAGDSGNTAPRGDKSAFAPVISRTISEKTHENSGNRGLGQIHIIIQDAAISFIDQNQTFPVDIWLDHINADLVDFSLSKPFRFSSAACLLSNIPNVHLSALVSIDPTQRSVQISHLTLNTDLTHLDPGQVQGISPEMPQYPFLKKIAGRIQLNLEDLEISPSKDLTANGSLSVTDGVIKDFNIFKRLLSYALGGFGGIDGAVDNLFNGQLKSTVGADDTTIENAQVQFSVHDKTVFIEDSSIKTNIFEFTAKGSVDQGLSMDMQTVLYLNEDVSSALVNELDGLKYLMDGSKRIAIDASLKGVVPHLKYKLNKDFRKKSKKIWMEEGGNILGVLFK